MKLNKMEMLKNAFEKGGYKTEIKFDNEKYTLYLVGILTYDEDDYCNFIFDKDFNPFKFNNKTGKYEILKNHWKTERKYYEKIKNSKNNFELLKNTFKMIGYEINVAICDNSFEIQVVNAHVDNDGEIDFYDFDFDENGNPNIITYYL